MEQGCQQLKGHDDMRGARWQIATRRTWSHSPQVLLWIAAHGEREPGHGEPPIQACSMA